MLAIRARWLALFFGWSLFGVLQALSSTVLQGDRRAWLLLFAFYLPLAWMWAVLTPLVGVWSRAIRRRFHSSAGRVAAHLPFLMAAALLHTWLRRTLIVAMGSTLGIPFTVTLLYFADLTIASYLAAVWAARVLDANTALAARERHTNELRRQLVGAQMEYLELQLRPHFLFNALSTITELAHEAPKVAARMLKNVASLLESAVSGGGRGLVPLSEELEALRPYLDIQRLRFTDWLRIKEDAADDAKRALVPRFILQPLVENAVHHGLIKRSARGEIVIRARVEAGRLLIAVVDNGVGLHAASYRESRGLGLANLRARLKAEYGDQASVVLRDDGGPSSGTAARLDLPLRAASSPEADQRTSGHPAARDLDSGGDPGERPNADGPRSSVARWAGAHPALAITSAWAVVGMLRIQHSYSYMLLRDRFTWSAMVDAIRYDLAVAALWLLLTPVAIGVARRLPLRRENIGARVLAHGVFAVALAYYHAAFTRFIGDGFQSPLSLNVSPEVYAWNIAVYAIILAIAHARALETWIRDREVFADQLRRELKEARFRRMMLELRPRVLLETLRHLVTLVAENAKRSERILADIGDFLRATLNAIHEPTITLREEGDTLRAYARLLGVASMPGLAVRLSVPLALMDERVPTGILRVALDSVLGDGMKRSAVVRLDVAVADGGVAIHATVQSDGGQAGSWYATVNGSDFTREAVSA